MACTAGPCRMTAPARLTDAVGGEARGAGGERPTRIRLGAAADPQAKPAKPKREPKPKAGNDPKLVAAARELERCACSCSRRACSPSVSRGTASKLAGYTKTSFALGDRWLEQVNTKGFLQAAGGKYDVSRAPSVTATSLRIPAPLLETRPKRCNAARGA